MKTIRLYKMSNKNVKQFGFTPTPVSSKTGVGSAKAERGFTLIELLVVISIIGLLASVVLISLNSARSKARDAKRKADLRQILTGIDLYVNDNGVPIGTGVGWWAQITNTCAGWGQIYNNLTNYMTKVPDDPNSTGPATVCSGADGWWYYFGDGYMFNGTSVVYAADRAHYVLCSKLENSSDRDYKVIANPWSGAWVLNYCIGY